MKNKGNSLTLLIIILSFLIPMFFNDNFFINFIYSISSIIILFYYGLKLNNFIKIVFYVLPTTLTIIVMNLLYPNVNTFSNLEEIKILNISIYKEALNNGINIFFKLFCIAVISISSISLIDIFELFYTLTIYFGLSKKITYPFFIAINSIYNIKNEYERIIIVRKLRKIKNYNIFTLFLPILVFAIRFSERSSMALIAKGFDNNVKNFYFYENFNKSIFNKALIFSFFIFIIYIVLVFIY